MELYSPAMIERAQANEVNPPKEVRVGGVFEVPWQGFHAEAMISSFRMLEDLRSVNGFCDGMFIKFSNEISADENACFQSVKKWKITGLKHGHLFHGLLRMLGFLTY